MAPAARDAFATGDRRDVAARIPATYTIASAWSGTTTNMTAPAIPATAHSTLGSASGHLALATDVSPHPQPAAYTSGSDGRPATARASVFLTSAYLRQSKSFFYLRILY